MNKTLSVTIGIPAYNEEANIKLLLETLLHQSMAGVSLDKILVVSDGSTDGTVRETLSLHSAKIQLIVHKKTRGQTYAQNEIFERAKSDVVVVLEADTLPATGMYLTKLIDPIRRHKSTGYVQGNIQTAPPHTFVGKVLSFQKTLYHDNTVHDTAIASWFSSGRGGRAFRKDVYRALRWPRNVPEDDFALLWCVSHGVRRVFQKSAICLYQCPQTFSDYRKQIRKNDSARESLTRYFPPGNIEKVYTRPISDNISMMTDFLLANPFYFLAYVGLTAAARLTPLTKFSDHLAAAKTTKRLSV